MAAVGETVGNSPRSSLLSSYRGTKVREIIKDANTARLKQVRQDAASGYLRHVRMTTTEGRIWKPSFRRTPHPVTVRFRARAT